MLPLLPSPLIGAVFALLTSASLGFAPAVPEVDTRAADAVTTAALRGPLDDIAAAVDPTACDPVDPTHCMFPFPSDFHTVADETSRTGRRVDISPLAMPRNAIAKPVDPTEWNRNDGFSPGTPILTLVPDLDLARTWGVHELPPDQQPHLVDPARYLRPDAPIILLDTVTGERHPFISELDQHPGTTDDQRLLQVRPLRNLAEGHRYVVALRHMVDRQGAPVAASSAFAAQRDGAADERYGRIFDDLAAAGVARDELFLAWDFTVASELGIAGRALSIRDRAFAELNDTDLADRIVAGDAPAWEVTAVEEAPQADTLRRVHLTVEVPNFLWGDVTVTRPDHGGDDIPQVRAPVGGRFRYAADDLRFEHPLRNELRPTVTVPFTCDVPATATADKPAVVSYYGHGLVGARTQYQGSSGEVLRALNVQYCSMEWVGLSSGDLPAVVVTLADVSNFPTLADRGVQGLLNQLFMGRALTHPDGPVTHEAFRDADGSPLFDPASLGYDGNSQGGIMGGALMSLSPDVEYGVLGATGMNYSTLLQRSVDWERLFGLPFYAAYGDAFERQAAIALIQQLWDRFESNGYAHHVTDDPYPNTPTHRVLLHSAWSDHQVPTLAAEIQARTYGAAILTTALRPGRHYSIDPFFGLQTWTPDARPGRASGACRAAPARNDRCRRSHAGSALVFFDSGNPTPPLSNTPSDQGDDPHSHPRQDVLSGHQRLHFLTTGEVVDVHGGQPYYTTQCAFPDPEHPAC